MYRPNAWHLTTVLWSQFLLRSTCPKWEPNSTEELQLTLGQLNEQLDELALASDKARPKT